MERGLSQNTLAAYKRDLKKLEKHLTEKKSVFERATPRQLEVFVENLHEQDLSSNTQARIVSAIKSFYRYLLYEGIVKETPAALLEGPKSKQKLPTYLTNDEFEQLLISIDLSKPAGERDKAMLEVLFSCGLRVSELIELQKSDVHFNDKYVRVVGKGQKERLVPIGRKALEQIKRYERAYRDHLTILPTNSDVLFLNQRGNPISRNYIFMRIKEITQKSGIKKNVSPHTLRHSFATVMIQAGADLRAVQQMLGHESITTTEIYTHLDTAYLSAVLKEHHPRS
jgi:integrase/recombinase XerD